MGRIASAALLAYLVLQGACAAESAFSASGDATGLTAIARTAKLALLCQRWPPPLDRSAMETALHDRILAAANSGTDRILAHSAIEDGKAWALLDFKASPLMACQGLEPRAVLLAAHAMATHVTARTFDRASTRAH